VRIGAGGRFAHALFSTQPSPPPPPLVRAWRPVPRPSKDPTPSRERSLELVLCGPAAWHASQGRGQAGGPPGGGGGGGGGGSGGHGGHGGGHCGGGRSSGRERERGASSFERRDGGGDGEAPAQVSRGGGGGGRRSSGGGMFGSSTRRFNLQAGGAQNGGGLHTSWQPTAVAAAAEAAAGSGGGGGVGLGSKGERAGRVTTLPEGWTYVVEVTTRLRARFALFIGFPFGLCRASEFGGVSVIKMAVPCIPLVSS
jgi:hypothetical protein